MNIVIVGLGALGTTFATLLKKSGHSVFAITKDRYLSALSEKKVSMFGIWGEHEAVLDGVFADIGPLRNNAVDIILLTVKSYDTEQAMAMLAPLVQGDTVVISAQNGYGNYEAVAHAVGKSHALLARIIFGARLVEPGRAEVTVIADKIRIGQPEGAILQDKVVRLAAEIDKAGVPTAYAADVNEILWDKILYNCALNPLGALLECNYGNLASNSYTRQLMNSIIREIFEVTRAHSIKLHWSDPAGYIDHFYGKLLPPTKDHYPSMYYDMRAGKKVEIDALNGAIVRLGSERGVLVPVNETITHLIKAKEVTALR